MKLFSILKKGRKSLASREYGRNEDICEEFFLKRLKCHPFHNYGKSSLSIKTLFESQLGRSIFKLLNDSSLSSKMLMWIVIICCNRNMSAAYVPMFVQHIQPTAGSIRIIINLIHSTVQNVQSKYLDNQSCFYNLTFCSIYSTETTSHNLHCSMEWLFLR